MSPDEIVDYFPELIQEAPENAKELINWFDENYVRGELKKVLKSGTEVRRPPRFHPKLWSVLENHKLGMPRTSNNVEGWHRRWNTLVNVAHPGLFAMIQTLKEEMHEKEGDIASANAGYPKPLQKKEVIERQARIHQIMENKQNYSLSQYIKALAYNMKI